MKLPNTYTSKNETGCCPIPNIKDWDQKEFIFEDLHFIRMYTKSFLYIPINMGKIMTALYKMVEEAKAGLPMEQSMILSSELSPFKAEQLYSVSKPIPGSDNVTLNGKFISLVFEGPYQDAGKWHKAMDEYIKTKGYKAVKRYFFYTTCPKCAKHYGKNYTIGLAQII